MNMKFNQSLIVLGLLGPTTFLTGQNNLIPEFTVDGMVKEFRENSPTGDLREIVQTTSSASTGDIVETTLVQEPKGGDGSVEFYIRIENGALLDVGGRNEAGGPVIETTVVEPLADFVLRPVLGEVNSDTGVYDQETKAGGMVVSKAEVEVSQENLFLSGFESVTVPAGTFPQAVRVEVSTEIETTVTLPSPPVPNTESTLIELTQWLVNGVGLVKQVATTTGSGSPVTTTRELLSYSVPGSVPPGDLPTGVPQPENGGTILPLFPTSHPSGPSFARPEGWHWTEGEWDWSDAGQYWYWIPAGPPFVQNTASGVVVPRPISGWNFYNWPYFYSADEGVWYFIFQGNLPYVFNPDTGEWRRWGE